MYIREAAELNAPEAMSVALTSLPIAPVEAQLIYLAHGIPLSPGEYASKCLSKRVIPASRQLSFMEKQGLVTRGEYWMDSRAGLIQDAINQIDFLDNEVSFPFRDVRLGHDFKDWKTHMMAVRLKASDDERVRDQKYRMLLDRHQNLQSDGYLLAQASLDFESDEAGEAGNNGPWVNITLSGGVPPKKTDQIIFNASEMFRYYDNGVLDSVEGWYKRFVATYGVFLRPTPSTALATDLEYQAWLDYLRTGQENRAILPIPGLPHNR